ncbi:Zn(2)-C6 fungal-type DNA-binding domain [Penicillium roqueforti FM164]|uniref:Zn(2)-C6 fungal-type DNA-binding domain n=1 Tax=Penicillium roqueforti (strain FM164) TaxID=1365484 RepID=W6QQ20_PENRF|nr:Zn(2)-C6 fungal-type DNA-binding domain [Penicillium roqueforti FM164]
MSQTSVLVGCEGTTSPIKPNDKIRKSKQLEKNPSRLRSACDGCHAAKVRCTGNLPCARCSGDNLECHYSLKAKIGKPRGSMNKKTIERLRQGKESMEKHDLTIHTPPPTSDSTPAIPPLPSCDEDSVFSPLPSPSNVGITLDSQGSSTFNPESLPFQELISPESGLGCMEDWLPTIPGESIDNVH